MRQGVGKLDLYCAMAVRWPWVRYRAARMRYCSEAMRESDQGLGLVPKHIEYLCGEELGAGTVLYLQALCDLPL